MTDIELVDGPLDGMCVPDGGHVPPDPGAYMQVPDTDARALYEPVDDDAPHRWHFCGWFGG